MEIMQDVMVDLETWGTKPGCAARSLGAVFFNPDTGELGNEFYATITDTSCKKLKLTRDQGTVDWWAKPENALANKQLSEGQLPIEEVIERFTKFWRGGRGMWFWGQGANFDEPILGHIYDALGIKRPWDFYRAQDTRTVYRMAERMTDFSMFSLKRKGTYHNALDDCKHQVLCVSTAHKRIKGILV